MELPLACRKNYVRNQQPALRVFRTSPDAVIPSKGTSSDVGYDVTIISKLKDWNSRTSLYGTGIVVQVPRGYYVELVARSSISKTGYMLANGVGIIDRDYIGELCVPLIRVDDTAPEIELPIRIAQIVLRKQESLPVEEVKEMFEDTIRGEGGFGST
jgi:dUTP pyrophosphatase